MKNTNENLKQHTEEAALSPSLEKLATQARDFFFKKLKPKTTEQTKNQTLKQ